MNQAVSTRRKKVHIKKVRWAPQWLVLDAPGQHVAIFPNLNAAIVWAKAVYDARRQLRIIP